MEFNNDDVYIELRDSEGFLGGEVLFREKDYGEIYRGDIANMRVNHFEGELLYAVIYDTTKLLSAYNRGLASFHGMNRNIFALRFFERMSDIYRSPSCSPMKSTETLVELRAVSWLWNIAVKTYDSVCFFIDDKTRNDAELTCKYKFTIDLSEKKIFTRGFTTTVGDKMYEKIKKKSPSSLGKSPLAFNVIKFNELEDLLTVLDKSTNGFLSFTSDERFLLIN